jgi:transglutaminase-like putative cysteine protease
MNQAVKFNFSDYAQKQRFSIDTMRNYILLYKCHPTIRAAALSILANVPARDAGREIQTIFFFVRDRVKFRGDVRGVETLQTPEITLKYLAGDCDDKVTLLNSLLETVGYKTRLVTITQVVGGPQSHVYSEVYAGGRWIPLETVREVAPGFAPPAAERFYHEY